MIEVRNCKYGRGLFATKTIPKGTIVEVSPVLIIPKKQVKHINETLLHLYVYEFKNTVVLALGNGSLFNHSRTPNVEWRTCVRKQTLIYKSTKPIRKGAQLFIDYGYSMKTAREFEAGLE